MVAYSYRSFVDLTSEVEREVLDLTHEFIDLTLDEDENEDVEEGEAEVVEEDRVSGPLDDEENGSSQNPITLYSSNIFCFFSDFFDYFNSFFNSFFDMIDSFFGIASST